MKKKIKKILKISGIVVAVLLFLIVLVSLFNIQISQTVLVVPQLQRDVSFSYTFPTFFYDNANWLERIFTNMNSRFIVSQSITGPVAPLSGSVQSYNINMVTSLADANYSDGTYSVQFANWALVRTDQTMITNGTWEQVNGSYVKVATITIPSNLNQHVLIAVIYQYNYVYDFTTNTWGLSSEVVMAKEGISLKTGLPVPSTVSAPLISKFLSIISSIWNFFRDLFGF